jgi:hypothetical protein
LEIIPKYFYFTEKDYDYLNANCVKVRIVTGFVQSDYNLYYFDDEKNNELIELIKNDFEMIEMVL